MLRFRRDRFLDVAPISGNNRIGPTGRLEIPGAVGEGLQIGADVRVYRGAAGELYLVPLAGQQVNVPNEGIQIGADTDIWRDASGNLSLQDTIVPYAKRANDLVIRQLIQPYAWSDFWNGAADSPWLGYALAGGTIAVLAPIAEHPGIVRLSSAAAANSGYSVRVGSASNQSTIIQGGEKMVSVFSLLTAANTTIRSGCATGASSVAVPTDGFYIRVIGTTLGGANVLGSVQSTTGTTYTITAGLWYKVDAELNVTGNLVTFRCYLCSTGALVWSDTLATNIPLNVAVRPYIHAYSSAAGPTTLIDLDYVMYYTNRKPLR